MKIKKDKYLRERGGTAKFITVACATCGNSLFVYQKDGPGWLKRCYLNRIISPAAYSDLQRTVFNEKSLEKLVCSCGALIGIPGTYKDGRLAYTLIRRAFTRKPYKS